MKPPSSEKKIIVRIGFAAAALSALSLLFGVYIFVWHIKSFFVPTQSFDFINELGSAIFSLVIGGTFLVFGFLLARQRYVVSLKGIEVTGLLGKRFVSWEDVEILNVIPTFMGASNIKIFLHSGKSATLFTAFLAHYERSEKAIIEAAYLANPNIKMNFVLGNDYGPPPYGIFTVQKTGA